MKRIVLERQLRRAAFQAGLELSETKDPQSRFTVWGVGSQRVAIPQRTELDSDLVRRIGEQLADELEESWWIV